MFQLLHGSPTVVRFAITMCWDMAFTHNTVMIILHKLSITRSQFLAIFYFPYASMLRHYIRDDLSPTLKFFSRYYFSEVAILRSS